MICDPDRLSAGLDSGNGLGGFLNFGDGRCVNHELIAQVLQVFVQEEPQLRYQHHGLSIVLTHKQLLTQVLDLCVVCHKPPELRQSAVWSYYRTCKIQGNMYL